MKKLLIILLVLCAITTQAQDFQQRIDSIRVAETTEDSTTYVVYFTTLGGYDNYTVEYKEEGSTILANILYSFTEQPQQTTIKIKNDTYRNAIVSIMNRFQTGGTNENPEYSDWEEVDSEEILLSSEEKEYTPLLSPKNQWNEYAENISLGPNYLYKKTYTTKIGNETLLNDTLYFQLLITKDKNTSVWEDAGYIREDVENRKVYYKPRVNVSEILLYNFSAKVGDVFQSHDIQSFDILDEQRNRKVEVEITVEAIDYILIDGVLRKRMQVRAATDYSFPQHQKHTWIEGIGNMNGFLRSTDALQASGREQLYLLCFLQNEELVYKPENAKSEECFVWQTTTNTIVNENSSWAVRHEGVCPDCPISTDYIYFDGDSVYNGKIYKKVFYYSDKQHTERLFAGLMREQNRKTYFIAANSEIEQILYDFSLKQGDTFEFIANVGKPSEMETLYVLQSDSVLINNELKKRLILTLKNDITYVFDTIIENVGSLSGLLYPNCYYCVGVRSDLLCYFENEELVYKNPEYSECYYNNQENEKEYTPLLSSKNQWNEYAENFIFAPKNHYKKTYTTKIGNEIELNDTLYYQLVMTKDKHASVWENVGYLREDVENRKVYYKPKIDMSEILLYNFSAEVGDVFQSYDIQCLDGTCGPLYNTRYEKAEIKVEAVDYIVINDTLRKRMEVRATTLNTTYQESQRHTWIEGVGNMNGFLRSTDALSTMGREQLYLLCFLQNEELIYKPENAKSEECFVWQETVGTGGNLSQNSGITVYPNPATDILTISAQDKNIALVEIFDMSGQKMYNQTHGEEINVGSLAKGNYLLVIREDNGITTTLTFIKN
ncbi:MAG: T9SS type A sorting domain-containing protein [Bacteroidetes bacterium]|nr:T9SS type A sorting domain-containing protein [Bacteroidota bacterium]